MTSPALALPPEQIAEFCQRNHIRKLSLFGSILTPHFRPESDIDILVEFEPGSQTSLFDMAGMELELTERMGRKVDLRTPGDLSRYFRERVVATAAPQYERPRVRRLLHMRDAAREALSFLEGRTSQNLLSDRMFLLAALKEIEIIGEAAGQISEESRKTLPRIPGGKSSRCETA